jgi:hypothetical protein
MAKLMEDLRFFIGAFFLIVGALLTLQGLFGTQVGEVNLNLITGIGFIVFALVPLTMALRAKT